MSGGFPAARYNVSSLVAVVTGGANGMVAAIAQQLQAAGAQGVVWDLPTAVAGLADAGACRAVWQTIIDSNLVGTDNVCRAVVPAMRAAGRGRTAMLDQMANAHVQTMVAKSPMRRLGEPHEVAALVLWLSPGDCSVNTGAVFDLSGGRATA